MSVNSLYIPANFEALLSGKPFLRLGKQLLYKSNGEYVVTTIQKDKNYTVSDYQQLPEKAPYQLIQGKLVFMASPYEIHQRIAANLFLLLGGYVKMQKLGTAYFAPLDVHFDEQNVFQPDVLFVSKERKNIVQKFIMGAPDLVVEILSKGTAEKDHHEKMVIYGQYNVLEYWMIHPTQKWLHIYENQAGNMVKVKELHPNEEWVSTAVKDFELTVNDLFEL